MTRKAVITGATKGIGRAIAEALATEGYDIAVCSRHQTDLDAMKTDFAERFADVQLLTKVVDVSIQQDVLSFAELIDSQWNSRGRRTIVPKRCKREISPKFDVTHNKIVPACNLSCLDVVTQFYTIARDF